MKVTIYGAGYVGLVTGTCLSDVGHSVLCMDINNNRVAQLNQGESPIHEQGLSDLLKKNIAHQRLNFTTDMSEAVSYADVQMIAVGTPQQENGAADLTFVHQVAKSIGQRADKDLIVVNKSTSPIGTAEKIREIIEGELKLRNKTYKVDIVSNPEFLREGSAIEDFLKPDRIIIGSNSPHAKKVMDELYAPFLRNHYRIVAMDIRSAELTKYAANAMLATKISFINEMALIADQVGADIEQVRIGIGSDPRIGYSFIYPGCGYGGSCFPKDVKALMNIAHSSNPLLLQAVDQRNTLQKSLLAGKIMNYFNQQIKGLKVAVWGLAFKPDTDDMREASSIETIRELLTHGAEVHAYDPIACESAKKIFGDSIHYSNKEPYEILDNADLLVIHTEWKDFRVPNLALMTQKMKKKIIFDGRNLYNPHDMHEQGWTYFSIGRNMHHA